MPALNTLGGILAKHPEIELVTITTDESAQDAMDTLSSVLGEQANFTTLVDSENEVVQKLFGTRLYPETWFIDPQGVIRARIDGPRDWHQLAPLSIEFAKSISGPLSCDVEFDKRRPSGPQCEGFPTSG
jgi:hypothetical protein